MSKVVVRDLAQAADTNRLPDGVTGAGAVRTIAALDGERDPIHVHAFQLEPNATIRWANPPHGCAVFVRSGAVVVEDQKLDTGSLIIVEHAASIGATAIEPTELVVFTPVGSVPERAGGHVHLLPVDRVPRCADFDKDGRVGGALYADSSCPTCALWLHETNFLRGGFEVGVHAHSEDEVIVVTDGEIVLGNRAFGPGTVIGIARETLYGFRTGPNGMSFLNFRPSLPGYIPAKPADPTYDERAIYLSHMAAPAATTLRRSVVAA